MLFEGNTGKAQRLITILSLKSIQASIFHSFWFCLTSESVCRSKDRRPSQSPQPEGSESWSWRGRWEGSSSDKSRSYIEKKKSNYCQIYKLLLTDSVPHMNPREDFLARRLDCPHRLRRQPRVVWTRIKQRQPEAKEETTKSTVSHNWKVNWISICIIH